MNVEEANEEIYMFKTDTCGACKAMEQRLKEAGAPYRILNASKSDLAREIGDVLDIRAVPQFVLRKEDKICCITPEGEPKSDKCGVLSEEEIKRIQEESEPLLEEEEG